MQSSLFRREALEHRRRRYWGRAVLVQPISLAVMTGALFVAVTACALFLVSNSYARSERVQGYLAPSAGEITVYAPRPAMVEHFLVREGSRVQAGDPLFTLRSDSLLARGRSAGTAMLDSLARERREIEERLAAERRRQRLEQQRFAQRIAGYEAELDALEQRKAAQTALQQLASERLRAARSLAKKGHLSDAALNEREVAFWREETQAASINQQITQLDQRIDQARLDAEDAKMAAAARQSDLRRQLAEIERQRIRAEEERAVTVAAPAAGRITAVQLAPGERANPERPALIILPQNRSLVARLLVPTRAAGLIDAGQEVQLMYDAFPHERFGIQRGTLESITKTILSPEEVFAPLRPNEPVYQARVVLERQSVQAYGDTLPLQAGMLLEADIVLERQSLMEWLLDPLLSLRGRT